MLTCGVQRLPSGAPVFLLTMEAKNAFVPNVCSALRETKVPVASQN